ncbi:MAG: hypothetical protein QNJ34_17000 [Xenococcaceae cyanobacterium MO_188.B29]|nr:hypothetical protein [Xenococcaceae cyanobacterium MO_188.B29]
MNTLKQSEQKSSVQWCSIPLKKTKVRTAIPQPQPDTWVQLLELFNPYCHDEALLLCQISNWEWIAWIPDHGEAIINIEQFCCPTS